MTACLKFGNVREVPTGTMRIPVVLSHGTSENGDWGKSLSGHSDGSLPIRTGYSIAISGSHQNNCGVISIPTHEDSDEDNETFTVALGSNLPSGVQRGEPSSVTMKITESETARADGDRVQYTPDDAPAQVTQQGSVSLSVSRNPVPEGRWVSVTACLKSGNARAVPTGTVRIPVVLSHGTSENGDWGSSLSGHTDGSMPIRTREFISISGSHQSSCGLVNIPTHQDSDTDDETFTVALGSSLPRALTAGTPNSVGITITDDDESSQQQGSQAQESRQGSPGTESPTGAISQSPYASLIGQIQGWRNDPQSAGNKAHTDRWDRALLAFGQTVSDTTLTPMTAAEAQTYADRGWTRWVEVVKALNAIEASDQQSDIFAPIDLTDLPDQNAEPSSQPTQVPQPLYDSLIGDVGTWRNDPQSVHHKPHTDRWDRVLLTLGEPVSDTSLSPMSASEAQTYADRGWNRWVSVVAALKVVKTGTSNADTLTGTSSGELLVGLGGDDDLSGLAGNDELRGGSGDDDLTGGAGSDRFVFFAGQTGAKAITDFASGDVVVLKGSGWSSVADIIYSVQAVGSTGYRYTLASGLTVETTNNRTLRTEDFVTD